MPLSKNNALPNNHFRKDWQRRVKTWFDQPGRKKSRRTARVQKAAKLGSRCVDSLQDGVVHTLRADCAPLAVLADPLVS